MGVLVWQPSCLISFGILACTPQAPAAKQKAIAEELDRPGGEVLKKLEDIRNKIL